MIPWLVSPLSCTELDAAAQIEASAPDAWAREALAEELAGGVGRLYGLREAGRLRGVAVYQLILDEASLLALTIEPAFRRQGGGGALLGQSLSLLRQEGARTCFLEVRSQNAPALALYRRFGFEQVGLRRGFYRRPEDDALLLRLRLG